MEFTFDEFKKGTFSVFFSDEDYKARVRFLKKCKANGINWGPKVEMDNDGISAAGMPDNADVILSVCQPQGWIVWGDNCENTLVNGRILIPYYKMEHMKCSEVVGTLYRDGEILFESKEKEEAFTADVVSCEELRACCEKITFAARRPKEEEAFTSHIVSREELRACCEKTASAAIQSEEGENPASFYNGKLRCIKSFCSSFFKPGNIYECVDGRIMSDVFTSYPLVGSPYWDFEDARFAGYYDPNNEEPWLARHNPYNEFEEVK